MADDPRTDPMSADEEIADEQSALGSATNSEAEDIDETLASVGLPNDDNGPKELNSEKVIAEADQNQD